MDASSKSKMAKITFKTAIPRVSISESSCPLEAESRANYWSQPALTEQVVRRSTCYGTISEQSYVIDMITGSCIRGTARDVPRKSQ